jgi:membrane protein implicated in regulation of membrane protease activity
MWLVLLAIVGVVACTVPAVLGQASFWLLVLAAVVARLLIVLRQAYIIRRSDQRAKEAQRSRNAIAASQRHLTASDRRWLDEHGWNE